MSATFFIKRLQTFFFIFSTFFFAFNVFLIFISTFITSMVSLSSHSCDDDSEYSKLFRHYRRYPGRLCRRDVSSDKGKTFFLISTSSSFSVANHACVYVA